MVMNQLATPCQCSATIVVQQRYTSCIRKMTKKFLRFPQPRKPRKPRKPHDLETYVSFPGNLLKRTFMYIFSTTKLLSRFPVSRFPETWKPAKMSENPETKWSSS